ncbi:MAG: hypothetical protein NVSMB29_00740 [Candidatus Dormibacteria bacterium]
MSARTQADRLGALIPDRARAVLVISDGAEVAVALRERVSRGLAVVRDVRPQEMSDGVRACRPWPWMVVGEVERVSGPVRAILCAEPVLIFWRGAVPEGFPPHVRRFASFAALAEAVTQALCSDAAGLRLAPGMGVELPDGRLSRSVELQALVSAHPRSFSLAHRRFHSSARLLARSGSRLRVGNVEGGGVGLLPAGNASPRNR